MESGCAQVIDLEPSIREFERMNFQGDMKYRHKCLPQFVVARQ